MATMKKVWNSVGKVAFWVSWPMLFFYLRFGKRTRVVIACQDEIVMTKSWLGSGRWTLPGGGIHYGESTAHGASREVYEEVGKRFNAHDFKWLGSDKKTSRGLSFRFEKFVIRVSQKFELKTHGLEIIDAKWVKVASLNEHNTEAASLSTIASWKKLV